VFDKWILRCMAHLKRNDECLDVQLGMVQEFEPLKRIDRRMVGSKLE